MLLLLPFSFSVLGRNLQAQPWTLSLGGSALLPTGRTTVHAGLSHAPFTGSQGPGLTLAGTVCFTLPLTHLPLGNQPG